MIGHSISLYPGWVAFRERTGDAWECYQDDAVQLANFVGIFH